MPAAWNRGRDPDRAVRMSRQFKGNKRLVSARPRPALAPVISTTGMREVEVTRWFVDETYPILQGLPSAHFHPMGYRPAALHTQPNPSRSPIRVLRVIRG